MTFGQQNTIEEAHQQLDYAVDREINFFDAAEMYPIPPKPETQGRTEQYIGQWIKNRNNRDKIVVATKAAGRSPMLWTRDNKVDEVRHTRAQLTEAVDKSLTRLQTDYIDLYQLHWPDRPMNIFGGLNYVHIEKETTPIEEILDILDGFVKQGKIRAIGLSNESPWGTMSYLKYAEINNQARVATVQNVYNLVSRTYEQGLSEVSMREDVGLLAYSPLAQGYLTGKYQNGALPPNTRKTLFGRLQRYQTEKADQAIQSYLNIAEKHGLNSSQMAIKFCDTRPFVAATIIGATTMEQLKTDIDAFDLELSEECLNDIEAAHLAQPNPCP